MEVKRFLSGLVASTMIFSAVPQTLVGAEEKNEQKQEANNINDSIVNPSTDGLQELENQRTAFTKTFKDNQGQLYKEIYAEPVHAKTNGTYKEIDSTVSTNPSDKDILATENTSLVAEFPKNLQQDTGFTFKKGQHQVEFELTGASKQEQKIKPNLLSKTSLENNKVQYNDVYPDVDLRHITFNEEVKEDWIIKKYTGINQFSYTLRTKLKPVLQQDGSIDFLEKTGDAEAVFTLPAPEMMDSNINEGKGEGTYSKQLRYLLEENTNGTYNLVLDIDKEWLASSDRKFPIYVDPSVSIDALGDAYISSKAPTTNFNEKWDPVQGEYVLQTGYYDSTSGTNYAFIKFSVANELKGAVIDSASLQAYVTHAYYATQKNGLWVDEANSKWAINEVNWNNKPSSTKISSTLVGRDEWAKLDVKSTLQAWVSEERPNTGFKLHTNGNGQTYWKKITASESANKPKLVISYHYDQMPTPTMSAQLDNATAKTGSVSVNWKSVFGASSYKLQMFDGYRYETVYTGSGLSWTSKDKKIFPKSPFTSSSRYKLDGTGTELPIDPSAFYSANLGSATTAKAYKFRVIPVYPTGDGPSSTIISKEIPVPAGEPDLPTVTTGTYSEADTINKGRGWLNVKWNKVANAIGYKVRIWNGSVYKNYTVGKDTTSISTKGKKIWPTDDQIKAGVTDLYDVNFDDAASIAKGAELPIDPSATYGSSSSRYSVRVIATSAAGDSPSSDVNYGYMKLYAPKNVSITANDDNLVQNKTSLTMKWSPSVGANYYEVQLNNGTSIEKYKVKGTTSFTTPKATYELGKTYTANVVAFFDDDDTAYESEDGKLTGQRGLSDKSITVNKTSSLREDLNGLEKYFSYEDYELGNALAFINVTTGNMSLQLIDETLYTKSDLEYDFTRTYNSRSSNDSVLGRGWTFKGNESLQELSDKTINFRDEDGTMHTFKYVNNKYISPPGLYKTLVKEESGYRMVDKEGLNVIYKPSNVAGIFTVSEYIDSYKNEIIFKRNEKNQIIEIYESNSSNNQEKILITYTNDLISQIKYSDHWVKYYYVEGNLVKTIIGNDKSTKTVTENFEYNNNQLVKYTDGKGNESTFKYASNELTVFDRQAKEDSLSVTNIYKYNQIEEDANKSKTYKYKYTVTNSSDKMTSFNRDESNNSFLVVLKDESGEDDQNTLTEFKFDNNYNLLSSISPNGSFEKNEYDANGNILQSVSEEGTESNVYNELNQLIKSTNKSGEETLNTYEGPSLIQSQTGNNEKNIYSYDSYGRLIKTEYINGNVEIVDYNDTDRTITKTDRKGNTTSETYSEFGQKIKETDADGNSKSYTYDLMSPEVKTSITDGNSFKTLYEHDDNNNITLIKDALNRQKSYKYNENDQVTQITLPNAEFNYEYDIDGNLSKTTLPSKTSISYAYNNDGQLSVVENGDKTTTYEYDDNGNIVKVLVDGVLQKENSYTADDLLKSYNLGSFNQSYFYNQQQINKTITSYKDVFSVSQINSYKTDSGEIERVQFNVGESTIHDYQSDFDSKTSQKNLTLNNDSLKLTTDFNELNLPKTQLYTTKIQKPLEVNYEYSKSENLIKQNMNGQLSTYQYDGNSQLEKEVLSNGTINTYQYDGVGNRITSTINGVKKIFTYNNMNQIVTKNNVTYNYDINGNLTQDENYRYSYNQQQQLIKIEDLAGKTISSYTYDENGLRLSKNVGNKKYEYFYKNDVLDMEVLKVDNVIKEYRYYEWSGYTPLGMIIKSDTGTISSYQFITNYRGDVLSIRDASDQVVASYQYDAYGNVLLADGILAKNNPIRYAGYYFDEETKNYYLQARYYNPDNGSFLALDPSPGDEENPMSQNGYVYADNNPFKYIDVDGNNALALGSFVAIPGIGWVTIGAIVAVVGSAWLVVKYGIPWAKKRYSNWYFTKKHINGWEVRVETSPKGHTHAHWKKNGRKGSCQKNGGVHHKGESNKPPKDIKNFLRKRGFNV